MTGTLRTMFVAFLGLYHKVYACGMLAGIVLSTTKVSEFLSAMNRIHAPKKFVITFAVMLRYIPTIQEAGILLRTPCGCGMYRPPWADSFPIRG